MKLWLKADAGIAATADKVGNWADQSGNTNDAIQSVATNQPTIIANALNGLPVIRFDGAERYFSLPNILTNFNEAEAFVVLKAATNVPSATRGLWKLGAGTGSAYANASGQIADDFGSTQSYAGNPGRAINQPLIYNVLSSSNNWAIRFNGTLLYERVTNTVQFSASPLLGKSGAGFEGDIAEVMLFNRILTDAERDAIGLYINNRYALITAPTTPTNLQARSVSAYEMGLSWNSSIGTNATVFTIERKSETNGAYAVIGAVRDLATWIDQTLAPDTNYFYRVKAWNYAGDSSSFAEVCPPVVMITNPIPAVTFVVGTNLTVNATASDSDGSINQVEFYLSQVSLGVNFASPYHTNAIMLTEGANSLQAMAVDDHGNSRISGPISITGYLDTGTDDGINLRVHTPLR